MGVGGGVDALRRMQQELFYKLMEERAREKERELTMPVSEGHQSGGSLALQERIAHEQRQSNNNMRVSSWATTGAENSHAGPAQLGDVDALNNMPSWMPRSQHLTAEHQVHGSQQQGNKQQLAQSLASSDTAASLIGAAGDCPPPMPLSRKPSCISRP